MIAPDTSRDAEARQPEGWRRMSSDAVTQTLSAAWSAGQRMARPGLRERFPEAPDDRVTPTVVARAEDIIGVRSSRSSRPWRDALAIANVRGLTLDRGYLARRAAARRVTDLVDRLWLATDA